MAKKRRYHPSVADDLSAAVSYYDNISVELGNRFRASVRKRLCVIAEHPQSFARIHREMRATMTDRFPYAILYEDRAECIAVLGVFHAASDQAGWFTRSL
ncbi:MAG: type II toxin-antitoxin system RelE/ParE family toxin [Planctomycetales bacterium]|nr:type II toxin-antitoxin system RelE/ParE family toxin [Planctomycetales bacterium]